MAQLVLAALHLLMRMGSSDHSHPNLTCVSRKNTLTMPAQGIRVCLNKACFLSKARHLARTGHATLLERRLLFMIAYVAMLDRVQAPATTCSTLLKHAISLPVPSCNSSLSQLLLLARMLANNNREDWQEMNGCTKKNVAIAAEEVMQEYQLLAIASTTDLLELQPVLNHKCVAMMEPLQALCSPSMEPLTDHVDLELQPVLKHKCVAMVEPFQPRGAFAAADIKKGGECPEGRRRYREVEFRVEAVCASDRRSRSPRRGAASSSGGPELSWHATVSRRPSWKSFCVR